MDQIGDTLGIGGIFRALRTIPVMLGIAEDMQKGYIDRLLSLPMCPVHPQRPTRDRKRSRCCLRTTCSVIPISSTPTASK